MSEISLEEISIERIIYEIRGKQVMLDSDLAKLYKCKNGTKEINQAVKNNPLKFPERFAFRISEDEYNLLKSNFLTSKGGSRKGHTVFTEQGVAMLATIIKTSVAIETSIKIMDAFVSMRHYISNSLIEQKYYNDMTIRHDYEIKLLQESFDKLEDNREVNEIYFDGKIYDAYSKILDIFKEAKEELIIVDRYSDKTILDIIKILKCKVIIITSSKSNLNKQILDKYNKTYDNLKIVYSDLFHDRYFVIDNKKIYHSGNSINHIGYRKSSIDVIGDENVKIKIMNDINNIIK